MTNTKIKTVIRHIILITSQKINKNCRTDSEKQNVIVAARLQPQFPHTYTEMSQSKHDSNLLQFVSSTPCLKKVDHFYNFGKR